jgi:hypothetical protein
MTSRALCHHRGIGGGLWQRTCSKSR